MPSDVKKLTYFGLHGRRSALCFQLAHAGCEFELRHVDQEEWKGMKAQYGGMPFATMADGSEIGEAMPLSRMIAIENGQYPEDPLQGYENDRLCNIYYDLFAAMSGPQLSGDNKRIKECAEQKLSPFLDSIEARLGKSKWLVGDKLCMIDFWVGAMICDKMMNDSNDKNPIFTPIGAKHPNFLRYATDFMAENKGWLDRREKFPM